MLLPDRIEFPTMTSSSSTGVSLPNTKLYFTYHISMFLSKGAPNRLLAPFLHWPLRLNRGSFWDRINNRDAMAPSPPTTTNPSRDFCKNMTLVLSPYRTMNPVRSLCILFPALRKSSTLQMQVLLRLFFLLISVT